MKFIRFLLKVIVNAIAKLVVITVDWDRVEREINKEA